MDATSALGFAAAGAISLAAIGGAMAQGKAASVAVYTIND